MTDAAKQRMTLAEFLAWDDGTDTRYELIAGVPVAMAPPMRAHAEITANIVGALKTRLKPPCRSLIEAGLVPEGSNRTYLQADIAVAGSPGSPGDRYLSDPIVIIEVPSSSTQDHDRGYKLPIYRNLGSVQEIALVSSTSRHVELWHRRGDVWQVQDLVGGAAARLSSVGTEIPLAEIYDGVALSPEAEAS
jgi:Uma2 family endonuclease